MFGANLPFFDSATRKSELYACDCMGSIHIVENHRHTRQSTDTWLIEILLSNI